jgi:hypothetical protein
MCVMSPRRQHRRCRRGRCAHVYAENTYDLLGAEIQMSYVLVHDRKGWGRVKAGVTLWVNFRERDLTLKSNFQILTYNLTPAF